MNPLTLRASDGKILHGSIELASYTLGKSRDGLKDTIAEIKLDYIGLEASFGEHLIPAFLSAADSFARSSVNNNSTNVLDKLCTIIGTGFGLLEVSKESKAAKIASLMKDAKKAKASGDIELFQSLLEELLQLKGIDI